MRLVKLLTDYIRTGIDLKKVEMKRGTAIIITGKNAVEKEIGYFPNIIEVEIDDKKYFCVNMSVVSSSGGKLDKNYITQFEYARLALTGSPWFENINKVLSKIFGEWVSKSLMDLMITNEETVYVRAIATYYYYYKITGKLDDELAYRASQLAMTSKGRTIFDEINIEGSLYDMIRDVCASKRVKSTQDSIIAIMLGKRWIGKDGIDTIKDAVVNPRTFSSMIYITELLSLYKYSTLNSIEISSRVIITRTVSKCLVEYTEFDDI